MGQMTESMTCNNDFCTHQRCDALATLTKSSITYQLIGVEGMCHTGFYAGVGQPGW